MAESSLKGRHAEYGRSVEDLTGVFSIEKFIQIWGNFYLRSHKRRLAAMRVIIDY